MITHAKNVTGKTMVLPNMKSVRPGQTIPVKEAINAITGRLLFGFALDEENPKIESAKPVGKMFSFGWRYIQPTVEDYQCYWETVTMHPNPNPPPRKRVIDYQSDD